MQDLSTMEFIATVFLASIMGWGLSLPATEYIELTSNNLVERLDLQAKIGAAIGFVFILAALALGSLATVAASVAPALYAVFMRLAAKKHVNDIN